MFRKGAIFLGFVGLMSATTANGQDGWVEVRAGIEINTAIAFGITVHTVRIDLTRPEFKVQVARHTDAGGFSTTDVWAREVGAVVAINGDWSDINGPRGFRHPTGLSIGDGMHWPNTADFAEWRFMACTVEKTCVFDISDEARDVHWTWRNVVGGNYALLVVDGVVQNQPGPFYNDDIIHRSAVGLSEDGGTMFLVVAEATTRGARSAGDVGLTWNEVGGWIFERGAHHAMMLDGGGSSTLVVNGQIVNRISEDAAPRARPNHLGIIVGDRDPRCDPNPNGRFCVGPIQIATCQGGVYEDGNCLFETPCEEGEGTAYCVHPDCQGHANQPRCLDDTRFIECELGLPTHADCGHFGLNCLNVADSVRCVEPPCADGLHHRRCLDRATLSICDDGRHLAEPCPPGDGCAEGRCVDAECIEAADRRWCIGDALSAECVGGRYLQEACGPGRECAGGRCVDAAPPVVDAAPPPPVVDAAPPPPVIDAAPPPPVIDAAPPPPVIDAAPPPPEVDAAPPPPVVDAAPPPPVVDASPPAPDADPTPPTLDGALQPGDGAQPGADTGENELDRRVSNQPGDGSMAFTDTAPVDGDGGWVRTDAQTSPAPPFNESAAVTKEEGCACRADGGAHLGPFFLMLLLIGWWRRWRRAGRA